MSTSSSSPQLPPQSNSSPGLNLNKHPSSSNSPAAMSSFSGNASLSSSSNSLLDSPAQLPPLASSQSIASSSTLVSTTIDLTQHHHQTVLTQAQAPLRQSAYTTTSANLCACCSGDSVALSASSPTSKSFSISTKYVKINVGGHLYTTSLETLVKQDTMLRAMFSGRMELIQDADGTESFESFLFV